MFLRASTGPAESGVYEFAKRYPDSGYLDDYAVTSEYNRAWLPASAQSGDVAADASASSEPQYLTGAPTHRTQGIAAGAVENAVSAPDETTSAPSPCQVSNRLFKPTRTWLKSAKTFRDIKSASRRDSSSTRSMRSTRLSHISSTATSLPVSRRDTDFGLRQRNTKRPPFTQSGGLLARTRTCS